MKTFQSDLSKQSFPENEKVSAKTILHSVLHLIQRDHPHFSHDSHLSLSELKKYRDRFIAEYLKKEKGELNVLDRKVLDTVTDNQTITDKLDGDEVGPQTLGQRVADQIAEFGGSWTFIISFGVFILIWILINVFWLVNRGFDPYPFILLNLILSCIASMQAPVIMMSQNRQEEKDRERARKDYMINLKSELEIRMLNEKIEHFMTDQYQEIMDMHKSQIEMMREVLQKLDQKGL